VLRTLSLYHRTELRTQGPALLIALRRAMAASKSNRSIARKLQPLKARRNGQYAGR
jgi:hypothetical protein